MKSLSEGRYFVSRPRKPLWAILILLILAMPITWSLHRLHLHLPAISLEYPTPEFNTSKVALLIENRPNPILAPLMLHFMAAVPPDWRFRFMGSDESLAAINRSYAIRQKVRDGKLDLTPIPPDMSTAGQEAISRFLTTLRLYEEVLRPAEWLLIFQTDSAVCANSRLTVDDFLEYDWVGAPWNPHARWGGNGGLSLRRVSAIVDVLRNQRRAPDSEPEDVWLTERLGHHPRANVANGSVSLTFSGEINSGPWTQVFEVDDPLEAAARGEYVKELDAWREGFYEPLGYHTGGSGIWMHSPIWGTPELRGHIYKYCPEVKMTVAMDVAKYVPGNCGAVW